MYRGGSWFTNTSSCRSGSHRAGPSTYQSYFVGFRVALPVDAVRAALKLTGPAMPQPGETAVAHTSDAIDYAAERQVAEWAVGAKTRFNVESAGQVIDITDVSQLPSGPFHIHALAITPQTTFEPSDFPQIGRLRGMIWLGFEEPLTDGSCLVEVGKVKSLEGLKLQGAQITDAHISALTGLHNLTELDLVFTPIGDAEMGAVAQLTSLKKLHLGESRVGDEGLAQIKTLSQLESLHLGGGSDRSRDGASCKFPQADYGRRTEIATLDGSRNRTSSAAAERDRPECSGGDG